MSHTTIQDDQETLHSTHREPLFTGIWEAMDRGLRHITVRTDSSMLVKFMQDSMKIDKKCISLITFCRGLCGGLGIQQIR